MEKKSKKSKIKKVCYGIKIIIVGNTGVGKTQILYRYAKGEFNQLYMSTVGTDFETCNVELDDKIFKLTLMDTAGQERFRSITRGYFKNVPCALIVYDITDKNSFDSVKQWINDCQSFGPKDIHLVLVGNKNDLEEERKIQEEEGMGLARDFGMDFFETSAKNGSNIEIIFNGICKFINKNINEGKYDFSNSSCGVKIIESTEGLEINKTLSLGRNTIGQSNIEKDKKQCC